MKKLVSLLILAPVGAALIVLSVANRQPVTLRLDPFNEASPAMAATLPFFAFLFAALIAGLVVGGVGVWIGQGRYRRAGKRERAEAARWRENAGANAKRADELAAELAAIKAGGSLPAVPDRRIA